METLIRNLPAQRQTSWRVAAVLLPLVVAACATGASRGPMDTAEGLFPISQDLTRAAVVKVLSDNGYSVSVEDNGRLIQTGYRQEIRGLWDWMVVYRFGTIRSWVQVRLVPEDDVATRVKIDVYCEGKDSLFGSWRAYETPLPQQAGTHLRQMKSTLELL